MTTPVNKIIQTLESILEQCKDKKDLATHNQIKDSSIYYKGMVDGITKNNQMKVYLVYKELGIDGIDSSSIKVFEHERDAFVYSFALKTHKDYNEDYYSVQVLLKEVI